VFVRKDIPDVIDDAVVDGTSVDIVTLLSVTSMVASKSEARRLIQQGGVSIDAVKITDSTAVIDLATPVILRVGKLRFLRVHGR
jgi:tyrosyl-tRNA synthetase